MANSSAVTRSGNQYIDGMISGTKWTLTDLTYYYPQSPTVYPAQGYTSAIKPNVATFMSMNADMQRAVVYVLSLFSDVSNLRFTVHPNDSVANPALIRYGFTSINDPQWHGVTSYIGAAFKPGEDSHSGDAWFPTTVYSYAKWDYPGSLAFENLLHETGHALGLSHPFDGYSLGRLAPPDHNSNEYTVMSYKPFIVGDVSFGATYLQSLMMDDIAALQYLYGANFNHNAGNTTYQWSPDTGQMTVRETNSSFTSPQPVVNRIMMTVWDGGGTDTYDFSNYNVNLKVNLQPGGWTTVDAAQLPVSSDANYAELGSIANAFLYNNDLRSLIENAIGGSGNDYIIGNQADNRLEGNNGADTLEGAEGADTLLGGLGNDSLVGGVGNDSLIGGAGDDQLLGGDGNDRLDGGGGNDTLKGGLGDDVYLFGSGSGKVTIIQGHGGADRLEFGASVITAYINWIHSGNDLIAKLISLDQVILKDWYLGVNYQLTVFVGGVAQTNPGLGAAIVGAVASNFFGSSASDTLTGTDGADLLMGFAGDDTLIGSLGNDSLNGGVGSDTLQGGGGNDLYVYYRGDGADTIDDDGGTDTLSFGLGISVSDLFISQVYIPSTEVDVPPVQYIKIGVGGAANTSRTFASLTDTITINNWTDLSHRIEFFKFDDGTTLLLADILKLFGTDDNDTFTWTGAAASLSGGLGSDSISTGDYNDTINGGVGNDTLSGGKGSDSLYGGGGDDTYIFNLGDGFESVFDEYIDNNSAVDGGTDTLLFGKDIIFDSLQFTFNKTDLIIGIRSATDSGTSFAQLSNKITISDFTDTRNRIEFLKFQDNSSIDLTNNGTGLRRLAAKIGTDGNDDISWNLTSVDMDAGAGNDKITAGSYNDYLRGGDGNDTLDGGGGNDTLRGGAGDDLYLLGIGSGKVTIIQGDGGLIGDGGFDSLQFKGGLLATDLTWTQQGQDKVGKLNDNDIVTIKNYFLGVSYQPAFNNTIYKLDLADNITGTAYSDVIDGSGGNDTIKGGDGNDTINGGVGNDSIEGGAGNDTIKGDAGDDTLKGGDGNDTIDGGGGNDRMEGGAGDDTYEVRYAQDNVIEGLNGGIDTVNSWVLNYTLPDNVENLILIPANRSLVSKSGARGNQLANKMTGNGSSNTLYGLDGNDTLDGALGVDQLYGGTGDDVLIGGLGDDTLYGGDGNDTYIYNRGDAQDTISEYYMEGGVPQGGGSDTLLFGAGITKADLSFSVSGNDLIVTINNQSGTITLKDWMLEARRIETFRFNDGSTLGVSDIAGLLATTGNDIINWTYTVANLKGGSGDDKLTTGDFDDTLTGGAGNDTLDGGGGADKAVYSGSKSQYTVIANNDGSYTIFDKQSGRDDTDRLLNIETLVFSDGEARVVDLVSRAPTITSAVTASVDENVATSFVVYAATGAASDAGNTVTWSISGGADAGRFSIDRVSGEVRFGASPDFEAPSDSDRNKVYNIVVQAFDGSAIATQPVAITVNNVNEAPVITSGTGNSTDENSYVGSPVYKAAGADPEGTPITWSLAGLDAAKFTINSSTGQVYWVASPDYEHPDDSGGNHIYDIIVQAFDGVNRSTQDVAITVNPVAETSPSITSDNRATVSENVPASTAVFVAAGSASDAGGALTWSLDPGSDGAKFWINSETGAVYFVTSPDYENPTDVGLDGTYNFTVRLSEGAKSATKYISVKVNDVSGDPADREILYDTTNLLKVKGGAEFDTLVFTSDKPPTSFNLTANGFEAAEGRYFDTASTFGWNMKAVSYDSSWKKIKETLYNDDGTKTELDLDVKPGSGWKQITTHTDGANNMDWSKVLFDDGSLVDTIYVTSGAGAGSSISTFYDAWGSEDSRQTVNFDQSIYIIDYDQLESFHWKEIRTNYDAFGRESKSVIINEDNTSAETTYDVNGVGSWATIVTNKDAQGRAESKITTHDDGSFELVSYTYGPNSAIIEATLKFNSDGMLLL